MIETSSHNYSSQESAQILQPLGAWKKTKIAFFAVFPCRLKNLRPRHLVIYVCGLLIAVEGQGIYIHRYTLSVSEVIVASIVALLCGLVLIFTILDELDREDPLNALLKTDSEDDPAAGAPQAVSTKASHDAGG